MAMRSQHMHDGVVIERRLRPIFDWLEHGNNKKALQEAEKVLKKTPNLQPAKALKALALLRLGKSEETFNILDALVDEKPYDYSTLQAMTICYRESYQYHKICSIFETAVKLDPTNEELHTNLFMAYVRIGDYKAQQQTAMALYKVLPKNPYYFWAIMSIVLQARDLEDKIKKNVLLTLAQRMIDKFIKENKLEAQQEIGVYTIVLELQNKHVEILNFMETPMYSKLVPGSLSEAKIPHLREVKRWKELNLLTKDLLLENLDRWDYYLPYLESSFELIATNYDNDKAEESESAAKPVYYDNTPEKCHEFICQLIENVPRGKAMRGPFLARLELYKRMLNNNMDPVSLMGGAVEVCLEYLRMFGSKACCASDLKIYLDMIPDLDKASRAEEFLKVASDLYDANSKIPDNLVDIQREISSICVWRYCSGCRDVEKWADRLRDRYINGVKAGLSTQIPTEFNALDRYAVLSVHCYYDLAILTKHIKPILSALNLIEYGLKKSPSNFHFKLLGVKLYHMLGAGGAAETIWTRLEVKHIQLSSLGWMHTALLPAECEYSKARAAVLLASRLHSHTATDSVEQLTYSYKYGTLDKLIELMRLRTRLEGCVHCLTCCLERLLQQLIADYSDTNSYYRPQPLPNLQILSDNRDLNVMQEWDPPQTKNKHIASDTFEHEKTYLLMKDMLLSALDLTFELADLSKSSNDSFMASTIDSVERIIKDWIDMFDKFKIGIEGYRFWWNVSAPFPSRIIGFVNSQVPYRELYESIYKLIIKVSTRQTDQILKETNDFVLIVRDAINCLDSNLQARNSNVLMASYDNQSDISNFIEFLTIASVIIGLCFDIISTSQSKKNKKKSNSKVVLEDDKNQTSLTNVVNEMLKVIQRIEARIDCWSVPNIPFEIHEEFARFSLEDLDKTVENKLLTCYSELTNGIKDVLKKKRSFLEKLIC